MKAVVHTFVDGVEGKVCPRCVWKPLTEFNNNWRTSDGKQSYCKECGRRANAASFKAHQASRQEANREWVRRNPEKQSSYCRAYRARDPVRAHMKYAAENANSTAVEYGVPGKLRIVDISALLDVQQGQCYYCHEPLNLYHVDHKIPFSRGGSNYPANVCLTCPHCNLTKHTKTDAEFSPNAAS